MPLALRPHSESRQDVVSRIEVDVSRPSNRHLHLRYLVSGAIGELRLPPRAAAARADELWRHSCFEAHLRGFPGEAYAEFNFAPSTQWAAYQFSGYRAGMTVAHEIRTPEIHVQSAPESFMLLAALDLGALASLPGDAVWRLGLSAVIEERSGRVSYWALAHPPGRPDFHHSDCFAVELPPPSRR